MQESMSRLPRICGLRRMGLVLTLGFVMFTTFVLRPRYALFDQDFGISSLSTPPSNRTIVIEDDMAMPAWPVQVADTGVLARQSLYTRSMFTPDATAHNHFIPISAIITRLSTDPRAIHHIVKHLIKYPFIKEIIVDDPFDNIDMQVITTIQKKMDGVSLNHVYRISYSKISTLMVLHPKLMTMLHFTLYTTTIDSQPVPVIPRITHATFKMIQHLICSWILFIPITSDIPIYCMPMFVLLDTLIIKSGDFRTTMARMR